MPRVEFDMDSDISSDKIIAALTDFTERRPELWPGLNPTMYEVYELGGSKAFVKEGTGGSIWAKERYDWSTPGVVRWEVVESGFCEPGSFVQAEVTPVNGGSRIHITWQRRPITFFARLMLGMIVLTGGAPVKSSLKKGLARIEAQS